MFDIVIKSVGMFGLFDCVLLVDIVCVYKLSLVVYVFGIVVFGVNWCGIVFVLLNVWDVVGVIWFGYMMFWFNCMGVFVEEFGVLFDGMGIGMVDLFVFFVILVLFGKFVNCMCFGLGV